MLKCKDMIFSVSFALYIFFKQICKDLLSPFIEFYPHLSYKNRAYAKLLFIDPYLPQDLLVLRLKMSLLCCGSSWPI